MLGRCGAQQHALRQPTHIFAYCSENLRITSKLRSSGAISVAAGQGRWWAGPVGGLSSRLNPRGGVRVPSLTDVGSNPERPPSVAAGAENTALARERQSAAGNCCRRHGYQVELEIAPRTREMAGRMGGRQFAGSITGAGHVGAKPP